MNKIVTILIFIMSGLSSFSQSDPEIDKLIDSLSWESITMNHSYHTFSLNYKDSVVKELLEIGKPATNSLLNSIKIPSKTVIIHIILTKIYEPDNGNPYLPISYIYKDCDNLIGWHHVYNGLIWDWFSDKDYTISNDEVIKIENYWIDRLKNNADSWQIDIYETFDKLQSLDSIKYPCNKNYENNSAELDIKEIINLLDTKYKSKEIDRIFKILGNDSDTSKFSDCFFISFGADGIDFRFNTDSILSNIFIEPCFKPQIIKGLVMSDTKKQVELKLGAPDKQERFRYFYHQNAIWIEFTGDDNIKGLTISEK